MLRSAILYASRNKRVEKIVSTAPVSRDVVRRYVAGTDTSSAVGTACELINAGRRVTLDHLGEDTSDRAQAQSVVDAYTQLITSLNAAGVTARTGPLCAPAEVSVKLSAVGQALGADGHKIALDNARTICAAAAAAGTTVTLDMEDHTTTDSTLEILTELRADFPDTAAVLQAYLHRTLGDCTDLATAGSRVRLCKGAYKEPASAAMQKREEIDLNYVRCANVLLAGAGYPMFATHDPRLVAIVKERALFYGRNKSDFELQMLYGIRPDGQRKLSDDGYLMRIYLPYGAEWYGYLMRRLAERPSNVTFFVRSLISKG